jgi:hypothetical protein
MEIILTIGQNCEIYSYSTKQRGYGRQSLYVELKRNDILFNIKDSFIKDVYVMDVFPNVEEHFDIVLNQDAFYNEEGDYYTDSNGNGEYKSTDLYDSILEALNAHLEGNELVIEVPDIYVIAWQENTYITKYHKSTEPNGTTLIDSADQFSTEEEAQELIDDNGWEHCYVTTL